MSALRAVCAGRGGDTTPSRGGSGSGGGQQGPARGRGHKQSRRRAANPSQRIQRRAPSAQDGAGEAEKKATLAATELDCRHFQRCSGCSVADALDRPSIRQVADEFFSSRGVDNFRVTLASKHGWRCRARLAVRACPDTGELRVGLYRRGTHIVEQIPDCRVHHPRINEAAQLVQKVAQTIGIPPYDEVTGDGLLRYIQLTVAGTSGKAIEAESDALASVQVALVWNCGIEEYEAGSGPAVSALGEMAAALRAEEGSISAGHPLLHSLWVNFQTSRGNDILGRQWALLWGEMYLWQHFAGADICFSPGSFAQVNFEAMDLCLRHIQEHVPTGSSVAEFHAGVGCIGLSLAAARGCRAVRGVEVNPSALEPYLMARQRLLTQLQEAKVATMSDYVPVLELHIVPAESDPGAFLSEADVAVMDPPRKGVERELMDALLDIGAHQIHTVVYLSCGFTSFMRDFDILMESGMWDPVSCEAFIFFPGADHIETLAVFKRRVQVIPTGVSGS